MLLPSASSGRSVLDGAHIESNTRKISPFNYRLFVPDDIRNILSEPLKHSIRSCDTC